MRYAQKIMTRLPKKTSWWGTAARVPILMLLIGLAVYGLLRLIAQNVDPADFANVIGLGAVLGALAVEIVWRQVKRRGGGRGR